MSLTAEIKVTKHQGVKCPRCWQYHGVRENYDLLCDKCQDTIINYFPDHESVPFIKESLEKQRIKYGFHSSTTTD